MQDEMDNKLDSLLRSHLRHELDPHVGSATRKLDEFVRSTRRHPSWLPNIRYAAAAVVMLGVGIASSIVYRNANQPSSLVPTVANSDSIPYTQAVQSSWTETFDQGTVMIDPQTPARMLRRVQYEKTDWKDPSGKWQSKIEIPNQDVILVDMPKQ